jgi:hypothetical protein
VFFQGTVKGQFIYAAVVITPLDQVANQILGDISECNFTELPFHKRQNIFFTFALMLGATLFFTKN